MIAQQLLVLHLILVQLHAFSAHLRLAQTQALVRVRVTLQMPCPETTMLVHTVFLHMEGPAVPGCT